MVYFNLCVYVQAISGNAVEQRRYRIPSWYCKPAILSSIAFFFNKRYGECLFVTCTKYGCRQFTPKLSKSYPVWHVLFASDNMFIPVFDECALKFDDKII